MEVPYEDRALVRRRQTLARRERSRPQLDLFIDYCKRHPHLRFWQALYGLTGAHEIRVDFGAGPLDPFTWEGLLGFDARGADSGTAEGLGRDAALPLSGE